jgi:hypothetical protein
MFRRTLFFVFVLGALTARPSSASSIVVNGGFETGTFANWTVTGGATFCPPLVASNGQNICGAAIVGPPHSGTYYAVLGNNTNDWFLDQTLITTPNQIYDLSFWLSNNAVNGGIVPNDFHLSWNGTQIYSASNLGAFGFTEFTFNGLMATGGSTVLRIGGFRQDPGYFGLDDVSVQAEVPEPVSLLLLGTGLLVLRRHRRVAR